MVNFNLSFKSQKISTALIFSPITMGYGSPQFLYMYDLLETRGFEPILFENYEDSRKFEPLNGYNRKLIKHSSIFGSIKFLGTISYLLAFSNVRMVVTGYDLPIYILRILAKKKITTVRYYLEIDHDLKKQKDENERSFTYKSKNFIKRSLRHIKRSLRQLLSFSFEPIYDAIIAPEENRLKLAREIYGNKKSTSYFLIENVPPLSTSPMAKKFPKKITILYHGQINERTLSRELFEAIKLTHSKYNYIIAGPCDSADWCILKELIDKKWVQYYGWLKRDDLFALRSKAHIGLVLWREVDLTTKYACPNKLYEFISAAMPVIFTPNYSLNNLNRKYHFGIPLEGYNTLSLVNAIEHIASNKMLYEEISANNLTLHTNSLNWEEQTSQLLKFVGEKCQSV